MSRQSFTTTLDPLSLVLGNGIYYDDVADTIGQLTYGFARNPEQLAGKTSSGDLGWGTTGNEAIVDGILITTDLTLFYQFYIYVDPDMQTLRCAAHVNPASGHEVELTFTVGTSGDVLVLDDTNTQNFLTLDVASTGSGFLLCELSGQLTSGSTPCDLIAWSISAAAIDDGDLPAPTI